LFVLLLLLLLFSVVVVAFAVIVVVVPRGKMPVIKRPAKKAQPHGPSASAAASSQLQEASVMKRPAQAQPSGAASPQIEQAVMKRPANSNNKNNNNKNYHKKENNKAQVKKTSGNRQGRLRIRSRLWSKQRDPRVSRRSMQAAEVQQQQPEVQRRGSSHVAEVLSPEKQQKQQKQQQQQQQQKKQQKQQQPSRASAVRPSAGTESAARAPGSATTATTTATTTAAAAAASARAEASSSSSSSSSGVERWRSKEAELEEAWRRARRSVGAVSAVGGVLAVVPAQVPAQMPRPSSSSSSSALVPAQVQGGHGGQGGGVLAEAAPSRGKKCPREVQVCLNVADRERGFVRSVTARLDSSIPELRQALLDLQSRSKVLPYADAEEALQGLREQFARGRRQRRATAIEGGATELVPIADAAGDSSQASPSPPGPSKASAAARKEPRRAASAALAASMKQRKVGLFAEKRVSPQLEAVVKQKTISYTECVRAVWRYVKDHNLQKEGDKKVIVPDVTLKKVCHDGEFNMTKLAVFLKCHLVE